MWLKFVAAAGLGAALVVAYVKLSEPGPTVAEPTVDAEVPDLGPPPEPADPDPARRAAIRALGEAGVPSRAIEHGVYRLLGARRAVDQVFPLVSFTCPIARDCAQVLSAVEGAVKQEGYAVVAARRPDAAGRPMYRALVKGEQPALALRALPGGPRISVVLEGLGADGGVAETLLGLPEHVTFAVDPQAPAGVALRDRLVGAGREVLAHVPMQPLDPALATESDLRTTLSPEQVKTAVGERLSGFSGVHIGAGGAVTASGPHISAALEAVAARGAFLVDPAENPDGLTGASAATVEVRTATATHRVGVGEDLAAQLRGVEAALVLDGRAVVVVRPSAAALAALPPWLAALERRKIHLLRMSEVVR